MCAFPRCQSAGSSAAALGSALLAICCLIIMEVCVPVNGDYDYIVEVKIFSYDNPTGRCLGCYRIGGLSCCDDFKHFGSCDDNGRRCDSYFIFCLRPFGMTGGNCVGFTQKRSMVNTDDAVTDFSESSEVLGLENPLILPGLTTSYDSSFGVQLFIRVVDEDTGTNNREGANEPDENVDFFRINHNLAIGQSTQRQTFNGIYGFVTMDLNITVLCVTGFTGPDCLEVDNCVGVNCSGCGQCVDGVDSFNCICDPGFTGDTCQTNIDECVGAQNCSGNGQCVDGVNSFTCQCSPGYSGTVCEIETADATDNSGAKPSGNVGGVIGGVVGVLIILILISMILIVFAIIALRRKKSQRKVPGTQGVKSESHERHREALPGDNPVYEMEEEEGHKHMNVNSMGRTESTVPLQANEEEREIDNVIYGFEDEDVGSNEAAAANCYEIPSNSLQHNVPCHEFDNPVYEIGNGEGVDTTYSLLSDPSAELYDTVTDQELKQ